jgi:hypothetical protein
MSISHSPKGLRADIYRYNNQDFSNHGISSRCHQVTIVGPGIPEVFEATDEAPAVELYHIGNSVNLRPLDKPSGAVGPMMGGCYVGSSDSRFGDAIGFYGAVALHDRFETPTQYDSLSR